MLGAWRGQRAEWQALRWLRERGLRPVARNYRCRQGEVDLIMTDHDTLVFVEVRWRSRRDYGGALASVTRAKQRRLHVAARHFLAHNARWGSHPCRFDVLGLEPDGDGEVRYQWVQNAFYGDQ
ncbi:YraN family protein [Alcanivoracaceae bacterium MT1]